MEINNPFERVTVLVNRSNQRLRFFKCHRKLDPDGNDYPPFELMPNKHRTMSASELLRLLDSSGLARNLRIKRSNQNDYEKDCLSGSEISYYPTIYFDKDEGGEDIKICRQEGSGKLLAEVCRLRLVRWFRRPPLLTEVPGNDQNAPSDQSTMDESIEAQPLLVEIKVIGSSIGTTAADTPASSATVPPALPPPTGAATSSSDVPQVQYATKRKNKSVVWEHFTQLMNLDGSKMVKPKAKCNYCLQTYFCHTKFNDTSLMKNHMLYQCKKCPLYIPAKKQQNLVFDSVDNGGKLVGFVEEQGFINFMKSCQSQFKLLWDLYQSEKSRIKNILATYGQRVSLTTDTWTSVQNINYMILTAHFIDDEWVLHKRILNFCVIPNHRGKTIGQLVETCLIGWEIEKVFCIVVDNASPNQVALDYMREKIGNWKELVLRGQFLHMRCCCHILNLIVKDGMEELDSLIDGIQNCVKYVRSSPGRLEKFQKCAAQEKVDHKDGIVPLDVCTTWSSTYFMLDIAIKYRKAFLRLEDEDSQFESYFNERVGGKKRDGPPIGLDWDKAARLVKFLKIFYDATLKFSGTQVVTTNQPLLWMCTIIRELEKCIKGDDPLLVSIGNSMKKKFDKYWGRLEELNKILLIAVVLDPRYKLLYLEYFFLKLQQDKSMVDVMVTEVKNMFLQLFVEYAENDPEVAQASLCATQPKFDVGNASLIEEDNYAASMNEFMKFQQEKDVIKIKNEVDKYLLEPSEDLSNQSFQVLDWWKENSARFPILSQIARDVMAVPASIVTNESAFSLGKRILDPFRASLTPKVVEADVCSSDWLGATSKPLFKEPIRDEMEQYEELEMMEADSSVTNVDELQEETMMGERSCWLKT